MNIWRDYLQELEKMDSQKFRMKQTLVSPLI